MFLVYKRVTFITETWFSPDQYERSHPLAKFFLRSAGFVMLLVALLGPYWGESQERVSILGREFYILLDVSASMNAEDVKPSRLERVKRELKQLITKLEGDKVGLVLFTENAYVQCPLTSDLRAVSMFLDMAETKNFAQTGTQFRSALATALDRFMRNQEGSEALTRAIILVSDGEDHGDTYASLIERLKNLSIRVFPVGVGTYEGAPIPNGGEAGDRSYIRYEDGSIAISRLTDQDLKVIAGEFGTQYVKLDQQYANLAELEKQIYGLKASPLDTQIEKVKNNQYQLFAFLAVILLFASMFLMPIRKE